MYVHTASKYGMHVYVSAYSALRSVHVTVPWVVCGVSSANQYTSNFKCIHWAHTHKYITVQAHTYAYTYYAND